MTVLARIIVGAAIVGLLAAGSSGAASGADSPSCGVARDLTASAHPQQAAARVDALRKLYGDPDVCRVEGVEALLAIQTANAMAATAAAAVPSHDEADAAKTRAWTAVRGLAQRVFESDADNARATSLLARANAFLQPVPALTEQARERSASWHDLGAATGADLLRLAGVASALLALIGLLARLLLLCPCRAVPRLPARGVTALVVDLVVTIGLTLTFPATWTAAGWRLVVAVALFWLAVLATWGWLFHRDRVTITMQAKGAASPAGATAVVAHLRSLGASPPRGVEIPLGGDADVLKAANIVAQDLPGVLGRLLGVVQALLAVTPWRVLVDADSDEQTSVIISRHGRVKESAVIRSHPFGPDGPAVDPLPLVAALALMTILTADRRWRGLGGTRDWMALGLQYVAATSATTMTGAERLQVLARAATRDPDSWLVAMSLRILLDKGSPATGVARCDELRVLRDWLAAAAGLVVRTEQGNQALAVRLRYSALATHLNSRTAAGAAPGDPDVLGELHARALNAAIDDLPGGRSRSPGVFRTQITSQRDALVAHLSGADPATTTASHLTPATAFSAACAWAQRSGGIAERHTVELLGFAYADPANRIKAPADVMLSAFVGGDAYRSAFGGEPRDDLLTVEPFHRLRDVLRAAGLTTPELLGLWSPGQIAARTGLSPAVARLLADLVELALAVPAGLASHRLEVLEPLASLGITGVRSLQACAADPALRADAGRAVLDGCRDRGVRPPDTAALEAWLSTGPTRGPRLDG